MHGVQLATVLQPEWRMPSEKATYQLQRAPQTLSLKNAHRAQHLGCKHQSYEGSSEGAKESKCVQHTMGGGGGGGVELRAACETAMPAMPYRVRASGAGWEGQGGLGPRNAGSRHRP